jgi:predicted transcriptional regulator
MRLLCEAATFELLPAVRALLTRELMQKYNYTQTDVAKALGITQPAVSQYRKQLRAQSARILEKDEDITSFVNNLAAEISAGRVRPHDLHPKFCEVCKLLRKKGIVCSDIPACE